MKKVKLNTPESAIEQARRVAENKIFDVVSIEEIIKSLKMKKQDKPEQTSNVKRSELFYKIYDIVKEMPREHVDGDAPDAISVTVDIEKLFLNQQKFKLKEEKHIDVVRECSTCKFDYSGAKACLSCDGKYSSWKPIN